MMLNQLDEIVRSAKPQLASLLQHMYLMLSMISTDAVVLVSNKAQHRLSSLILCLSSRWSEACKEDERKLVLAGIAPGGEVTLLVDV